VLDGIQRSSDAPSNDSKGYFWYACFCNAFMGKGKILMTTTLPAHLQNRQTRSLIDHALTGIGGALPPHLSIGGNRFTLVDAAGSKQLVQTLHLDCCIVDLSDHMAKQYYEYDYEPGSDDPPTCYSTNGIVPDAGAAKRQARTCAECPQNSRGSATSKLSGKPIKACRDEKWLAILLTDMPGILFQLKVTPGSFKNWASYVERVKNQGVDMNVLLTRLSFEPEKNGVLTFAPINWIDAAMADMRDKAYAGNATDILVGRSEAQVALPGPTVTVALPRVEPQQIVASAFATAPFQQPGPTSVPLAEPGKRKRRTKAEIAAANAANGGLPSTIMGQPSQQDVAPAFQKAPFRPDPAPVQPAPFGIQQSNPMPAAVSSALDDFFGK